MPLASAQNPAPGRYYIGLMSGTSTDGVDGILADFQSPDRPVIMASTSQAMPQALRDEFLALNHPGSNELERAARAGNQLADLYALATRHLLQHSGIPASRVQAIGAHGQTVRHDPEAGYTIQINAPARLAETTGIAVIADFRSRDIAAGGQGAPLVPAFHRALFASHEACRAVLNLGGIANVTLLPPGGPICGFDTGPANVLLDTWIQKIQGKTYDHDGAWAATGRVNKTLLDFLTESEPWLEQKPPKSTGRHLFNLVWLENRLAQCPQSGKPFSDADVQATLQAFTARTAASAVRLYGPDTTEVIVCGGGALNKGLMNMLKAELPACTLSTTAHYGIPVQQVEALAFAWLAKAWDQGMAAGLPAVTGARAERILGCRYPG